MTPGRGAKLEVLKFAEDDFSFHWTKEGSRQQIKTTSEPNVLTFQSVSEEDLGYYRCEVKEAGRVVLTIYRALYMDTDDKSGMSLHKQNFISTTGFSPLVRVFSCNSLKNPSLFITAVGGRGRKRSLSPEFSEDPKAKKPAPSDSIGISQILHAHIIQPHVRPLPHTVLCTNHSHSIPSAVYHLTTHTPTMHPPLTQTIITCISVA